MNIKKSADERQQIARKICAYIEAAKSAKGTLADRWQRAEDLYYVVPGTISMSLPGNTQAMTYGLWRQKADRIVGSAVDALTSVRPYAQVLKQGESQPDFEDAAHEIMRRAGFETTIRTCIVNSLNTNAGCRRLYPMRENGQIKLKYETIHPRNMTVYPLHVASMDEVIWIGHMVPVTVETIKERIKSKRYYSDVEVTGSDDARKFWDANQRSARGDLTESDSTVDPNDGSLEVYEGIVKIDGKRYLAQVSLTLQTLLSLLPYEYPSIWYVFWRTEDEDGKVFPSCSVAQTVQAPCVTFAEAYNLMRVGSQYNAFPVVIVTGGQMSAKAKSYGPGEVWEFSGEGVKVDMLRTQFDPGALPMVAEKMEEQVDALTGINRLGTGQNLPASTKATAIDALMSEMAAAQNELSAKFSDSVEAEYALLMMYIEAHYADLMQAYPAEMARMGEYPGSVTIEATGRSTGGGSALRTKIRAAMELAMTPGSKYDVAKIADRAIQALDLPFDVAGLEKDGMSEALQALAEAQDQLGLPPEEVVEAGLTLAMQSNAASNGGDVQAGGMEVPPMAAGSPDLGLAPPM